MNSSVLTALGNMNTVHITRIFDMFIFLTMLLLDKFDATLIIY